MRTYVTVQEWQNEGEERFGIDMKEWKFKCPSCGRVNTAKEFIDKCNDWHNTMCQECIGNYVKGEGCNYKAYGFLPMTCDTVIYNGKKMRAFPFAEVRNENT